ncbi:DCC1-like thiol-disulfide oxidoreductase family protein [Sphingobacterium sp. LRF_L2]|uniref:DCC1-like thiol-disulfide oxidoreductase family protein n=1 Tax=Sphingobacterium sp. LRF_L2 TaxID=3369421 RepID=UPI003F632CC1
MKTLKNHLILFDAECPMCRIYTRAFVKSGMLDSDGRMAYQEVSTQDCPVLDRQRAINEIALFNRETGEVTYGVESLFKIFATSFPMLKPLFLWRPFLWLMSKIYAFISFNRRVIIPATSANDRFELQPTFKLNYRLAYLFFTWLLTSVILASYGRLILGLLPEGPLYREYLICAGQILFQGASVRMINKGRSWDYLGNMMTISFGGAILLFPMIFLGQWLHFHPFFYASWFLIVVVLMLLEHIRRTKLLGLGWLLTCSWILYRILVILLILLNS